MTNLLWTLPPLPTWAAAHPLIVHVPLGVLLIVPVVGVLAMFSKSSRRVLSIVTLALIIIGTVGTIVAVQSGEAAEHATFIPAAASDTFDHHEDMALLTRNLSMALTGVYVLIAGVGLLFNDKVKRFWWMGVHTLWLAGLVIMLVQLAWTGHLGARLVHEFGVRAPLVDVPKDDSGR